MNFEEFRDKTKNVTESRTHKVKDSIGIRQIFLFVQKNKWFNRGKAVREQQFQQIVRNVNNLLTQELIDGKVIKFPQGMGALELRKLQNTARIVDGKLKVSYPIDWDATLKLWYEDQEALQNKTIVRVTDKEVFKILYNKTAANYPNKGFFEFKVNRDIKVRLKRRIKQGRIEAFTRDYNNMITD